MPINWNQTASGGRIDLLNPDLAEIDINDLLQGVAGIWRFNNQLVRMPWSVLMHTINLSWVARKLGENKLIQEQLLFHDLHEAYIGDLTTSLKTAVPQFRGVDIVMQRAVFQKFNIPHPYGDIVKDLDMKSARWEAELGFRSIRDNWTETDLPKLSNTESLYFDQGISLTELPASALKRHWLQAWKECRSEGDTN